MANAIEAFDAGLISQAEFIDRLTDAVNQLDAYQSQLEAKIEHDQIDPVVGVELLAIAEEIHGLIVSLLDSV